MGRASTVGALHGDMQPARAQPDAAAPARRQMRVLVATDVAARGIDVPGINLVVNYDAPHAGRGLRAPHRPHRPRRARRRRRDLPRPRRAPPRAHHRALHRQRLTEMVIPGLEPKARPAGNRNASRGLSPAATAQAFSRAATAPIQSRAAMPAQSPGNGAPATEQQANNNSNQEEQVMRGPRGPFFFALHLHMQEWQPHPRINFFYPPG